jgi:hypothetical protein
MEIQLHQHVQRYQKLTLNEKHLKEKIKELLNPIPVVVEETQKEEEKED